MEASVIAGVLTSVIGGVFLYLVAKVNTKAGNEAATVESALKLQKRYEEMYDDLELDVSKMKTEFNSKIEKLHAEMKEMKKQFDEKETYYKSELEKKDDRIDELEGIIIEKDNIIEIMKGERANGNNHE